MLPFGVTILATVPQRSEIPKGLMSFSVCSDLKNNYSALKWTLFVFVFGLYIINIHHFNKHSI